MDKLTAKFDNILVMGKSGAGKQPRIDILTSDLGMKQLSTGNIFRSFMKIFKNEDYRGNTDKFFNSETQKFIPDEEIKNTLGNTVNSKIIEDFILGLKAHYFVSNGYYVPDSLTNQLFESYFSRSGYRGMVLDGYPRTIDQADFLLNLVDKKNTKIDLIILVENDDDLIIKRTMGRRICPSCGAVYHLEFKPPKDDKFCTKCGTEVILRSDDTEEKLRIRLEEFQKKTLPTLRQLEKRGIPVVKANGNLPVFTEEAIRKSLAEALKSKGLL